MNKPSRAYRVGQEDGWFRVEEAAIHGEFRGLTQSEVLAKVRGWVSSDQETPDTALINALGQDAAAKQLGVSGSDPDAGNRLFQALGEYNQGFRVGIVSAAEEFGS